MEINKDKYYGTMFGFILGDLIGTNNNIYIKNRKEADFFQMKSNKLNFSSLLIIKMFEICINGGEAILEDQIFEWFKTNKFKENVPSAFTIALRNYKNRSKQINYFTDYFGLVYSILNILLNNEKEYFRLTHNMPVIKLCSNIIINYLKYDNITTLYNDNDFISQEYVGNSDAIETLRCVFKVLQETNNFYDGLITLLNTVENTHAVCIIYGIMGGYLYGLSDIFESRILIDYLKKLEDFNKIMDLLDKGGSR